MYKGVISNATAVANTNIGFSSAIVSNANTLWKSSNNTLQIRKGGYFEIDTQLAITGVTAGNITCALVVNGTALTESQSIDTSSATTDAITLNVHDVLKINPQANNEYVEIGVQLSGGATVTSGLITVQEVR